MEAACPAAPLSLSLSSLQPPPLARCPGATNWWYLSCNLVSSCLCTHMEHLFQLPLSLHTQAPVPAASLSTHTGTCSSCLSLYTRGTCSSCLSLHTRAPVPAASLSTHTSTCSSCLSLYTHEHLFQLPLSLHTRAPVPAASLSTHTSTCSSCLSLYTHEHLFQLPLSLHTRGTCSSCLSLYTHEHLFQLPLSTHTGHLFQLPLSLHTRGTCSSCLSLYTHGAPVPAASLYTHGAPVPAASLCTHGAPVPGLEARDSGAEVSGQGLGLPSVLSSMTRGQASHSVAGISAIWEQKSDRLVLCLSSPCFLGSGFGGWCHSRSRLKNRICTAEQALFLSCVLVRPSPRPGVLPPRPTDKVSLGDWGLQHLSPPTLPENSNLSIGRFIFNYSGRQRHEIAPNSKQLINPGNRSLLIATLYLSEQNSFNAHIRPRRYTAHWQPTPIPESMHFDK
ncbi:uncharacterized protein LOC126944305 isoform X37 [Macaca thibetana thibetana]|uniref:uncharacterized protein LOC126944305 isoform X34 n=1 Tax=Macaca thibetana thibetana TaxID=257877 RepID=UPI0021BC4C90|nr:uncharacterized protein LOC126944305 isoform X34 [Macaca thibetana thibetana]XP_050629660.1 uncharacterized protein LOC126944305 isoform X37 [Macaca thibetana thibetana]